MAEIIPLPGDRRRTSPEPLWREALGALLRRLRLARGERLADTARRAGVSPQYLSEVERGLKEPSSEMIAAIGGALGVTLVDLTATVAIELRAASPITRGTVAAPAVTRGTVALAA
jgi:transcriptional regulator with XRE-family HTH domain